MGKGKHGGYSSAAQRKAVHASKNEAAGKMKHGSHAKMYGKSPAKAKGHTLKKTSKAASDTKGMKTVKPKKTNTLTMYTTRMDTGETRKEYTKPAKTKKITEAQYNNQPSQKAIHSKAAREKGYMMNYNTGQFEPTPNKKGAERRKAANLKSPLYMSNELTYGGPVIDQMGNALSHMGAMKVLKHSKSRM